MLVRPAGRKVRTIPKSVWSHSSDLHPGEKAPSGFNVERRIAGRRVSIGDPPQITATVRYR